MRPVYGGAFAGGNNFAQMDPDENDAAGAQLPRSNLYSPASSNLDLS